MSLKGFNFEDEETKQEVVNKEVKKELVNEEAVKESNASTPVKKKKGFPVIAVLGIVFVILVIAGFVVFTMLRKNAEESEENTQIEEVEDIEETTEAVENIMKKAKKEVSNNEEEYNEEEGLNEEENNNENENYDEEEIILNETTEAPAKKLVVEYDELEYSTDKEAMFTVTKVELQEKESDGYYRVESYCRGSISGIAGTYYLNVPYSYGIKKGNALPVKYKFADMDEEGEKTAIIDLRIDYDKYLAEKAAESAEKTENK